MVTLQELIDTANNLSINLEVAANQEMKFCVDIQLRFEQMSWDLMRTANELKEIKGYI